MSSRERPGPLAHLGRTVGDAGRYSGGEGGTELHRTADAGRESPLVRAPAHEPALGSTLGRDYRLTAVLVRTLDSTIYAAEHVRTRRKLAIKVWRKHLEELELDQFRIEAEVLASIRHPHVAQVIDFGSTDDRAAYLVMELLEGHTLETLLERGPLAPAQVARLTRQIASALAAAHRAGLAHTDLRPHNVLLVDVGRDLYAKLLDFGLTKRLDGPRGPSSGPRVRSEHAAWYRAPELGLAVDGSSSDSTDGARSDQFSLACVVYEMFTGQRPFPTTSNGQAAVHRAPARSLGDGGYSATPELEEAMARALSIDPALRFEQLGDFAQVVACSAPADRTLVTRAGLSSLTLEPDPGAHMRGRASDAAGSAEHAAASAEIETTSVLESGIQPRGGAPSGRPASAATLPDGVLPREVLPDGVLPDGVLASEPKPHR